MTTVLEADSSYMQTEIDSEEDLLLHELLLKSLITWTRWWHLTAKALTLVLKKKVFGVERQLGLYSYCPPIEKQTGLQEAEN